MAGRLHALILADGACPPRAALDVAWPGWADGIGLVIAADGGERHAARLGFPIDRWVGDGDSTGDEALQALVAAGVTVDRAATDKDESDTELALLAAIEAGADEVSILGALGGPRLDHALANVSLLLHPAIDGRGARLYDEHAARLSVLAGPDHRGVPGSRVLAGSVGDLVSLIPLGESAHHVETEGLRYPLRGEPLLPGRARGVSNVRVAPEARVTVGNGRLLVIETPVTVGR